MRSARSNSMLTGSQLLFLVVSTHIQHLCAIASPMIGTIYSGHLDHAFCTECLEGILKTRPIGAPCPSCREPFTPANIRKIRVRTSNSSISSSDSSKSDYIKTRQDMQIRVKVGDMISRIISSIWPNKPFYLPGTF